MYSAVISLARLAGKTIRSASRSNRTAPFSASIKMACGAPIFGSSFFCGSFLVPSFFCAAEEAGRCDDVAANAGAHRHNAASTTKHCPNAKFRMTITESSCRRRKKRLRHNRRSFGGQLRLSKGHVRSYSRFHLIARRHEGRNRRCIVMNSGTILHDPCGGPRAGSGCELSRRGRGIAVRCLARVLAEPVRPIWRRWNFAHGEFCDRAAAEICGREEFIGAYLQGGRRAALTQRCHQLAVIRPLQRGAADIVHLHASDTVSVKAEEFCCLDGHIDKTIARIWPTIVDAHDNRAAVGQIRHTHVGRQWQRWMRGRDRIHVEDFPVGRVTAMEIIAIPRGHALRAVVDVFFGHVNPAAYHVRLTNTIHAAALRHRLARLDDPWARCDSVARVDLSCHSAIRTIGECQTAQAQDEKAPDLANFLISPETVHPVSPIGSRQNTALRSCREPGERRLVNSWFRAPLSGTQWGRGSQCCGCSILHVKGV